MFLRLALIVIERLWLFWVWLALGDGFFGVRVGGVVGHACVELNLQSHVSLGSSAGCAKHLQLLIIELAFHGVFLFSHRSISAV